MVGDVDGQPWVVVDMPGSPEVVLRSRMTKSSIFIRLSWTAAPIPPEPTPTISTSKCSELMARIAVPPVPAIDRALPGLGFPRRLPAGCVVIGEQRRIVVFEFKNAADAGEVDPGGHQVAVPWETP